MSSVPALDRTVAVVALLAEDPNGRFTLSELCRRLEMSKATAHGLLAALCDHGWLWRDPGTKSYTLGAGLVTLADQISVRRQALVSVARADMEQLAAASGARVVASSIVGDDIVMLAVAGDERPFGTAVRAGQRLPLKPPLGTVFLAWADAPRVDRWLRDLPVTGRDAVQRHREAIDVVRRRGYAVTLESPARRLLGQAISDGTAPADLVAELDRGEYVLYDLEPDHDYRVSVIAAPVFDARGRVAMALSLFDLPAELSAAELVGLAELVVGAGRRVTKHLGGVPPEGANR